MVTIAPDDDEDGRTDGCVRGGGSTTGRANAERSNVDARRGSVANGETRKEDARERERECVCRAPTRGDLAHEDAHVVRV
jgi:hypothetical protein